MEKLMRETASTIVAKVACLKRNSNVLVVCGLHNKVFAEQLMLETYAAGAHPYLWVFDEKFFLKYSKKFPEDAVAILPKHVRSLLENSDVIIWLSQFDNVEKLPVDIRKAIFSFWDTFDMAIKAKPRLYVTLLSAICIERMNISYSKFLHSFVKSVNVDYNKLRKIGNAIASKLNGKKIVHVCDANGTDLTFSIYKRPVGVEAGTLEDCYSKERECEVEVPAGEVYVAPLETSANGMVMVREFRDYAIENLKLRFKSGRIVSFKAEKGGDVFKRLLEKAEGDKDRIAEFGVGINYGMKPMGYRLFDEKALGTVHIAIGNNVHLGGVNKASIHYDFVLYNPNVKADNVALMIKGKIV
jgi:leucyl aminopeptidase (aminopeptidase T)